MEKLKRGLLHLQKEEFPVGVRLNDVSRGGKLYVKGFGRNLTTGLVHIFDSKKYGVWNSRSHKVVKHLDRLFDWPSHRYPGRYGYLQLWLLLAVQG